MIRQLFSRKEKKKEIPRPLAAGTPAPPFSLPSSTGDRLSLDEFRGRPVVLVFYPADNSPVCSSQLALYNEALRLFQEYDAQIVGISSDDPDSHKAFTQSLKLDFPLLADHDPAGAVARAYGVYREGDGLNERALFVVDGDGVIRWSYVAPRSVNPGADGILHALDSLAIKAD